MRVTLKGYTWRTTVAVYGGEYYIGVSRPVREQAGVVFDEPLHVTVELDTAPREVDLPDDLRRLLGGSPALKKAFNALSFSNRKEYVDWIDGAKRADTRKRRLEQAADMLRTGVKTPKP